MKVEQVMTKEVQTCTPENSLRDAARIMWEADCGCIPILSCDGTARVIGMITDRDVCMGSYLQGRQLAELRIADAMSTDVVCCKPSNTVAEAEALMKGARVHRVPVVDEANQLLGIISLTDIVQHQHLRPKQVPKAGISDTLAKITEPRSQEKATIM